MQKIIVLCVLCLTSMAQAGTPHPESTCGDLTDAPPSNSSQSSFPLKPANTYEDALKNWQTPEDMAAWMASFKYDKERAVLLSETAKAHGPIPEIYEASRSFANKNGTCLDLARFSVDTLKKIAPELNPKYVMVKFNDTVTINGSQLRLHWFSAYQKDGKYYFFGDTRRPGEILGPYDSTERFKEEYAKFRCRSIATLALRDSYKKHLRLRRQHH